MKILMISHWFPPANIIGAVRPYEMAKYLSEQGHNVTVVCGLDANFDNTYEVNLTNISVIRVKRNSLVSFLQPASNQSFVSRILKATIRYTLYPDSYNLLRKQYIKQTVAHIKCGFEPDVVISSALPFSSHMVAKKLAKIYNCPWVADNRDLWAISPYRKRFNWLRAIDIKFEASIMGGADAILVIGNKMKEELLCLRTLSPEKVFVIRNGADLNDDKQTKFNYKPSTENGSFNIVYSGILYGGYRDPTPALNAMEMLQFNIKFDFYGSEESVVAGYQDNYKNIEINFHKKVSKFEIKSIQKNADILLLALGCSDFEKSVLTGKFFEYVESGRPIIAVCDEDSELAQLVSQYGLGIATRNTQKIKGFIQSVVSGDFLTPKPPMELSRVVQFEKMEKIIKRLTNES
jgi:glycosyltransferase involved in cell wall biosynthesis